MIQNYIKNQKPLNLAIFFVCTLFSFLSRYLFVNDSHNLESKKTFTNENPAKTTSCITPFKMENTFGFGIWEIDKAFLDLNHVIFELPLSISDNTFEMTYTHNIHTEIISIPSNVENSTSSIYPQKTTGIAYLFNTSIPIVSGLCTIEPITMIYMQELSHFGIKSNENRFGGRIFFTPYIKHLKTLELGYLINTNFDSHQIYIGLHGNLFADYNLCSSIKISETSEDSWNISNELQKTHIFKDLNTGNQHSLTIKTEEIWYPIAKKVTLYSNLNFELSKSVKTGLSYSLTSEDDYANINNYITTTISTALIKGINFTISTSIATPLSENQLKTTLSGKYTF
jgi:hypothetical protein